MVLSSGLGFLIFTGFCLFFLSKATNSNLSEKSKMLVGITDKEEEALKTIELINKSYDTHIDDGLSIESIEFGKLFDEDESNEGLKSFIPTKSASGLCVKKQSIF